MMLPMGTTFWFWWQIPLLALVVPIWVFGGGAMLYVGVRQLAKVRDASFWRSVIVNSLSGVIIVILFLGGVALATVLMGRPPVNRRSVWPWVSLVGGAVLPLFLTWLSIKIAFGTTLRKAMLAWLATLAPGLVAYPLLATMILPSAVCISTELRKVPCQKNLDRIAEYLAEFKSAGKPLPRALTSDARGLELCRCPAARGLAIDRQSDYFYYPGTVAMPFPSFPPPGERAPIIVCDLRGNHKGGRYVLLRDGAVLWMTEAQFQNVLGMKVNARFAEALKEVENRQGLQGN